MDCIKYVNTRPIQKFANIKKNAWFGNVSNPGAPLYQENSFAKYDYMQSSYDRRMQTCNKAYTISKGKVENYRNNIHYTHMRKFQLKVVYERKMKKREKIERAAIKIQKVIRGFLTRKKYQNVRNYLGTCRTYSKRCKSQAGVLGKIEFFFLV